MWYNIAMKKEIIRELTETQYLKTMGNPMKNITDDHNAVIDIWGYAGALLKHKLISDYGYKNKLIEAVYSNADNTYQHVLLFTDTDNCFVVIIIDVLHRQIYGHYLLDLNKNYKLNSP